jgi:hypothetical protein
MYLFLACYDVYLPDLTIEYSPKDESNCTSSYNVGIFQPIFKWTPAKWYSGVQRSVKWVDREANK